MQIMFHTAAEESVRNIRGYVTKLKEWVANLQNQKQLLVCQLCFLFTILGELILFTLKAFSFLNLSFELLS